MKQIILRSDGGARGNPGPAGIGVVLEADGQIVAEISEYIGEATNNVAEYSALIAGLKKAKELAATTVQCFLDSQLIVEQMNLRYKVKNPDLGKLFLQAQNLAHTFSKVTYQHVPRELNKAADALVNKAIDSAVGAS
ncbi:MAG: reverse transcriptase-like protein [Candidatus Nomurabacteria bacterium]|nr:MAG: reverse transcriptase-like protein [Candidatus Nomurabacteria bacterium]